MQQERILELNHLARLQISAIIGTSDIKMLMSTDKDENK
jgi:hypothetical protein